MIKDEERLKGKSYVFSRNLERFRSHATVRLISSEIFNVCSEVPILFARVAEGWHVLGLMSDPGLRVQRIDMAGRWTGRYVPFTMRIFPFILIDEDGVWDVADEGVVEPPARGRPFFLADGSRSAELDAVFTMLREATEGLELLSRQAMLLGQLGFLVPLPLTYAMKMPSATTADLFCIDRVRLLAASGDDLARLVDASPSALDLAIASVFSMRLLNVEFSAKASANPEGQIEDLISTMRTPAGHEPLRDGKARDRGTETSRVRDEGVESPDSSALDFALDGSESIDFSKLET